MRVLQVQPATRSDSTSSESTELRVRACVRCAIGGGALSAAPQGRTTIRFQRALTPPAGDATAVAITNRPMLVSWAYATTDGTDTTVRRRGWGRGARSRWHG